MPVQTIHVHFNLEGFLSLGKLLLSALAFICQVIEPIMYRMVQWYDLYMYTPLQIHLSPYMALIPREIRIGDKTITVFNANIVTYSRTLLIIPIAWCLKFDYSVLACLLVLFHDFLDHVDGIVAKVHKRIYGDGIDDPLLGGFMDAFCDKIVNVFCLWTILQETNFQQTSFSTSVGFVLLCYTIIALETAIGVVRVQDYFTAALNKNKTSSQGATAAGMEGKLKEKLESMGLAFLCLSTGHLSPFDHWSGIAGIICFALTIRLAYLSFIKKLQAREPKKTVIIDVPEIMVSRPSIPEQTTASKLSAQRSLAIVQAFAPSPDATSRDRALTLDSLTLENDRQKRRSISSSLQTSPSGSEASIPNGRTSPSLTKDTTNPLVDHLNEPQDGKTERSGSTSSSDSHEDAATSKYYQRSASLPAIWIDGRADKVFTVGCFDLFHEGHIRLLQRMRQYGRQVIVGVHDSRSIHKLKKRVPVDGTETRMLNVKLHADQVYCVSGTDPSNFVKCAVHLRDGETALYVRGDDMADFPSRHVVEELMPVKFLPYTEGVSSTQLRKDLFSHIQADDMEHLEKVN